MRRAADPSRPSRATLRQSAAVRFGALVLLVVTLVGSLASGDTPEAAATASDEAAFVNALNDVRADAGLPPFTMNVQLADLARDHAQVMADAGEIFHADPISAGYEGPWAKIGENVGVGANVAVLVDAFVASPGHYANIIDPAFTEIGVGVVWRENAMYTTHRFLQAPGQATTTTAPPATTTTTPPPTTTVAPGDDTVDVTPAIPTLPTPSISAERIVALLDLLDRVGT